MTHCGLLRDSTSFHRTTMLGRYLSTIHLWTLRKHSILHGLCTSQTYKYPYDTWSAVEFFLLTIYSLFYPRTLKPPLVIFLQVWTVYSSELRLHCHLCRARCAVSTISILWTLPPVTLQHWWMHEKKNVEPEITWSQFQRRFTPGFKNILDHGVTSGWYDTDNTFQV